MESASFTVKHLKATAEEKGIKSTEGGVSSAGIYLEMQYALQIT